MIKDSIQEYQQRVSHAINYGKVCEFAPLFEEGIQIKRQIDTGYLFKEYSTFKVNRDMMKNDNFLLDLPKNKSQIKDEIENF